MLIRVGILTVVLRIMTKILNSKEGSNQSLCQEVFVTKAGKNTVSWIYGISKLNAKEIVGTFYKEELRKTTQTKFKTEKTMRKFLMLD